MRQLVGRGGGSGREYGIGTRLVLPSDAARKSAGKERSNFIVRFYRQVQRGVPVGVAGDAISLVASVN